MELLIRSELLLAVVTALGAIVAVAFALFFKGRRSETNDRSLLWERAKVSRGVPWLMLATGLLGLLSALASLLSSTLLK